MFYKNRSLKLNKNISKLSNTLNSFDITLKNLNEGQEINSSCIISLREKDSYYNFIAKGRRKKIE